jgi:hypothetical protein
MKKTFLLGSLLAAALFTNAQQRLVLYEEFSGENCPPCALYNPDLMTLLASGTNPNKVMLIKYQSPIPSAGPIYYQNTTDIQNRMTYYTVPFAPYGRLDGALPSGSTGNIHDLTQAHLDAATAITSPFNITVTNTVTGTTLNSTINVSAVAAYTGTGVKLRAALVESLSFATPPGTNGETEFHHVVRKMYPTADGQTIPDTWTNGQTGTYTFSGAIPSYVDRTHELFVVVWIQNDGDKKIAQAAKSTNLPLPLVDVGSNGINPLPAIAGQLNCGVNNIAPKVTIKNTGTSALTSAQIYYRVGTGAWSMQPWTGSLAANASTDVTITTPIPGAVGYITIQDSVAMPNGAADINAANNLSLTSFAVVANTAGQALPISTNFEANTNNWVPFATTGNFPLPVATLTGKGYDGSNSFLYYPCFNLLAGQVGYNVLPFANIPAGAKTLDFYVAHAMYTSPGDDKLEVVYSTNCGQAWTSLWNQAGTALATAPPTASNFVPSGNSQWAKRSVDMTAVPANAQVAFRATSQFGNNIFVDNVNFRTGSATGIEEFVSGGAANIYPNPVTNQMTVALNMVKSAKVSFQVVNMLGQQVGQSVVKDLTTGQTNTTLSTNDLAPGVYFLNIITDKGNLQQKFVKK